MNEMEWDGMSEFAQEKKPYSKIIVRFFRWAKTD